MQTKLNHSKLLLLALLVATAAGIAGAPLWQKAEAIAIPPPGKDPAAQSHRVEVVFVLDTTSSMSGLIQAAKEKIWSIASTMASARQNPDIRMGLVAFRDRGDVYVTRRFDLSQDLDSMYSKLMDLRAEGGGDTPESVNQALHEAVHDMSWSRDDGVYRVVFLVGDAPPHMDYADEVQYPQILDMARQRGIVVNAIQSGEHPYTRPAWQQIAALGGGEYFQVEQSGNAVAVTTPFDAELSSLASELEDTRLFYGDSKAREAQAAKLEANARLRKELSPEALARRDSFNATRSGKANLYGDSELVDAVTSGRVELEEIAEEELPSSLQALPPEEQQRVIVEQAKRRDELERKIEALTESRDAYIASEVEAAGGADDSLDEQIYRAVRKQGADVGLSYDSDSARY